LAIALALPAVGAASLVDSTPAAAAAETITAGYSDTPCADNGANQVLPRSTVLTRAQSWVDAAVSYSRVRCYSNQYGDYRTDCSGFVAMAWGVGGLGDTWWTGNFDSITTPIPASELQPGDALLRSVGDPNLDHVALFVSWADGAKTQPVVMEETGGSIDKAIKRTWTWGYSGYTPVRYDNIGCGQGIESIGVYRPSTSVFYLRNTNNSGGADLSLVFGNSGDTPITGDWNGA
jgi:hypothetical protein